MSDADGIYLAQLLVSAYWAVLSNKAITPAVYRGSTRIALLWAASFVASWVVAAYCLWRLLV